jgi:hypothetical protein
VSPLHAVPAEVTESTVKVTLMELDAAFKSGENSKAVASARIAWLAAGLRLGIPVLTLERQSGVSRQTIRRINPATGEVLWVR